MMLQLYTRIRIVALVVLMAAATLVAVPVAAQDPTAGPSSEPDPDTSVTDEEAAVDDVASERDDAGREGVGERVAEVVSRRTLRSKTWQLDTGEWETEIASVPIHYDTGDGDLVDLDPTLTQDRARGADGQFVPSGSPHDIKIARRADGGVSFNGARFTLAGAAKVSGELDDAGRVVYPNVVDGVDWRVWTHALGVGEDLVIANVDAAAGLEGRIDYLVDGLDGADATVTATGQVVYRTGDNEGLVVGAPFAADAAGVEADATWEVTDTGLSMVLPAEWLASDERQWPVVIDPDVVTREGASEVADAYIAEQSPSANRGINAAIKVSSDPYAKRGLVDFDVRSIFDEPVQVTRAELQLTIDTTVSSSPNPQKIDLHEVTTPWGETDATWNNAESGTAWTTPGGDYNTDVIDTTDELAGKTSGDTLDLHLPDVVQGWVDADDDAEHGLALIHASESDTTSTKKIEFRSAQHSAGGGPRLKVWTEPILGDRGNQTTVPYQLGGGVEAKVNIASGNLYVITPDHSMEGRGNGVAASRHYNSRAIDPTADLGLGWSIFPGWGSKLRVEADGDRVLYGGGLGAVRFNDNGSGYDRPVGLVADLDTSGDPNTLTFPQSGAVWEFDDSSGLLEVIDDGDGNQVSVAYTTNGAGDDVVDTVTHDDGNTLTYSYLATNRLGTVTDNRPSGLGGNRTTTSTFAKGTAGRWQVTTFTDRAGNTW